jgi:hypothetical protein
VEDEHVLGHQHRVEQEQHLHRYTCAHCSKKVVKSIFYICTQAEYNFPRIFHNIITNASGEPMGEKNGLFYSQQSKTMQIFDHCIGFKKQNAKYFRRKV